METGRMSPFSSCHNPIAAHTSMLCKELPQVAEGACHWSTDRGSQQGKYILLWELQVENRTFGYLYIT